MSKSGEADENKWEDVIAHELFLFIGSGDLVTAEKLEQPYGK